MPLLKFRNYLAASRKPNLLAFGMYKAEAHADIDVIEAYGFETMALVVTGTQDGTNTAFTLSGPLGGLYLNGLRQSSPGDYTYVSNTITFVVAPQADDIILALSTGSA